ncbi:MAG TPA: hemerythrin domain-containing protein [Elusimicrobiota bacterium]|nr:hemerythrin domain-containing protein [Elusimicrobiota bacterium]
MLVHDPLIQEHAVIRRLAGELWDGDDKDMDTIVQRLARFQKLVMNHFACEDAYYAVVDAGKRFPDRHLIHDLRNDHAAVVFSLESLSIRLKKNGATPEWKTKLNNMLNVLLPHLDREEQALFPEGTRRLTNDELSAVADRMKSMIER